jgi:putative ABC transport system permease protein
MFRLLYRLTLRLSPAPIRREYGAEMEEIFAHCVRVEQRRGGRRWWPSALCRGIADAIAFAWFARFEGWWAPVSNRPTVPYGPPRRQPVRAQDIRSALRLVKARPYFAAAVIGMLALGLGSTAAIFSVIHGVLLKPLPFPDEAQLVRVYESVPTRGIARVSLTEAYVWDVRDRNRSFSEYGGYHGASYTLTGHGAAPQRVSGALVSVGFLRALGVTPVVGRLFVPGEDEPGASTRRVVLSHVLWSNRFDSDRSIVGRTITLDGVACEVIGVLPPGSPWLDDAEVFVPFVRRVDPNRTSWEYASVGRLKPGVTLEAAMVDLDRVAREIEADHPATDKGVRIATMPSSDWIAPPVLRQTLWTFLGAVGVLLVIACVNVTNLLLAHASARRQETAVRAALGASRGDLIRERLTESLVLSLAGALAAWPLAAGMLRVFKAINPGAIPRLATVDMNGWLVLLTFVAAALVGVLTGVLPAWRGSTASAAQGLRHGQRAIGDRRDDRMRNIFVGVEVALSLVLLVGAGLLVKSLMHVLTVDRGFQTEQRLLATVSLPGSYPIPRREQIVADILGRLEHTPGIVSVAAVSGRPLAGGSTGMGIVAADHDNLPDSSVPWASWRNVTKDYFKTMGLTLQAGRVFTEQDISEKPWRVVISRRLATLLWQGQNPVGRNAILWKGQTSIPAEVIGVVSDMRERGLENEPTLAVYLPAYGRLGMTSWHLVLHTAGPPEDAVTAMRRTVQDIDATLPFSNVRTLEEIVTGSMATRRFTMWLIAVFAGIALVLAIAGVYGVLAYTVARRTAEIGVRMALGAAPGRVLRGVFNRGMRPVAIGLALGLAGAIGLSRYMASLLFQVEPRDPSTYAVVTATLLVIAALACYLPARKVLRVDPVIALRTE